MLKFAVSEEKNRWLVAKMEELSVKESDFAESFVRSSGSGGQHVNKTSTRVQLIHKPTSLSVSVSKDRSQSINRFLARRELLQMIEALQKGVHSEQKDIEKIKRQKACRKRKSRKKREDDYRRDLKTA